MVYAQDRAAAWLQFIVVTFVLQLFLREEGDIEGKGPVRIRVRAGGSQAHAVPLDVHVIAVVVASVLLRPDVIFMHGCRGSPETAVVSGVMLINIGLSGPHAIVGDAVHIFVEEQTQTDSGQGLNLRVFGSMDIQQDPAVRKDGDRAVYSEEGLN